MTTKKQPAATAQSAVETTTAQSAAIEPQTIRINDRTFRLLPLSYDSYIEFMGYLQPFVEPLMTLLRGSAGADMFRLAPTLAAFAKNDLPKMAVLVINQQAIEEDKVEDMIDVLWLKKNVKSPLLVAKIVMAQVAVSGMLGEFLDLVVTVMPQLVRLQNSVTTPQATQEEKQTEKE